MERLTEKQSSGYDLKAMNGEWCNKYCDKQIAQTCNECGIYQAIQKLAEYEDLEEQGLLLRLPLKIGDTVYSVTRDFISEYTICSIEKYNEGLFFNWRCEKGIYINVRGFTNYQIGKDVFLTKAEAEQKLKETESD